MTLANLSILKTGKARAIRFSTLDAICEVLACQPGDTCGSRPSTQNTSDRQSRANGAQADKKHQVTLTITSEST